MKQCPYCAEEIQDIAIKCKHCGESLIGGCGATTLQGHINTKKCERAGNKYPIWKRILMIVCGIIGILMALISVINSTHKAPEWFGAEQSSQQGQNQ